jgi:hypothetical protein
MRRILGLSVAVLMAGFAVTAAADVDVVYAVRVDNIGTADVMFKLDSASPCTAPPHGSCKWEINYGLHTLDAYVGDRHYSRTFELSDESAALEYCKFDGTAFSGDSC